MWPIKLSQRAWAIAVFVWMNPEKDSSLRSSGRGCTDAALATRSTTSDWVTASSSESITAKASPTPPFMLTRSELTLRLKRLRMKSTNRFPAVVTRFASHSYSFDSSKFWFNTQVILMFESLLFSDFRLENLFQLTVTMFCSCFCCPLNMFGNSSHSRGGLVEQIETYTVSKSSFKAYRWTCWLISSVFRHFGCIYEWLELIYLFKKLNPPKNLFQKL